MKNSLKEKTNLSKEKVKKISQAIGLSAAVLLGNGRAKEDSNSEVYIEPTLEEKHESCLDGKYGTIFYREEEIRNAKANGVEDSLPGFIYNTIDPEQECHDEIYSQKKAKGARERKD